MPNPNNAVSTELDAVNQILASVGQAPVTTLNMQNPETFTVLQTLRDVNRQVQAEGWVFNTERFVKFKRDSNNEIEIPNDVLQLDANRETHRDKYDLIRKNGKLYDKYWHLKSDAKPFKFDEDLTCDVTYYYRFNDLPYAFQSHIIAKAARQVATKLVGSTELVQLLAIDEETTKVAMMEYESQQGDFSIFGHTDGNDYYSSYQPFQALKRQ